MLALRRRRRKRRRQRRREAWCGIIDRYCSGEGKEAAYWRGMGRANLASTTMRSRHRAGHEAYGLGLLEPGDSATRAHRLSEATASSPIWIVGFFGCCYACKYSFRLGILFAVTVTLQFMLNFWPETSRPHPHMFPLARIRHSRSSAR